MRMYEAVVWLRVAAQNQEEADELVEIGIPDSVEHPYFLEMEVFSPAQPVDNVVPQWFKDVYTQFEYE